MYHNHTRKDSIIITQQNDFCRQRHLWIQKKTRIATDNHCYRPALHQRCSWRMGILEVMEDLSHQLPCLLHPRVLASWPLNPSIRGSPTTWSEASESMVASIHARCVLRLVNRTLTDINLQQSPCPPYQWSVLPCLRRLVQPVLHQPRWPCPNCLLTGF